MGYLYDIVVGTVCLFVEGEIMITGVRWFTSGVCIGIVQVVQDHQKEQFRQTGQADYKYYIGPGAGVDEKNDMESISDWGAPFDKVAGDALFGVE